jgi:hypothetical protein
MMWYHTTTRHQYTVNEIVMNTSKNTTCTYLLSNVPIQSWPRSRRNRSSRTVTIHNGVLPLDIPTFVAVACFAECEGHDEDIHPHTIDE